MLKRFGFFDAKPRDEAIAELKALQARGPMEDESRVLEYLKQGTQLMAVTGLSRDVLCDDNKIIGPPHVFCDGEWCWTSDVIYYVFYYHIAVPTEFLERIRSYNCTCPAVANPRELVKANWEC